MSLTAFSTAERALRVKRRNFSKEINAILDESKSEAGLHKAAFDKKRSILRSIGMKLLLLWKNVLT